MGNNTGLSLITDFTNLASQKWVVVNDGVMGGVSQSSLQINDAGNGVFIGRVSLENNGGFASVKQSGRLNFSGYSGIFIRILGDGKRYSFRFRTKTGEQPHYWVYNTRFETQAEHWDEIFLPFYGFNPVYRGRELSDIPSPDLSAICEYGFLISDKQEGPFRLEIDWVKAVVL
jgi:NADH dehydrogenase [ubiquinone] 1 alpha subcomplex assembly factor 1